MRIMNPTISVIMGAYNCARTLPEAIAAIQHQTVSDWEFIICDDGSSDETWQVASEFQRNDERIGRNNGAQDHRGGYNPTALPRK